MERYGQKVGQLAELLRKNPGSVSRLVADGTVRLRKEKAFHAAAAEKLDAALRQAPTRTTEGRSHNVVRL